MVDSCSLRHAILRFTEVPYNFSLLFPMHMRPTPIKISSVKRRNKGFTLIELLVVLAILTMLAGLVGPRVLSLLGGAKSKTAAVQIADLEKSLELFKLDVGRFPATKEGLAALVTKPESANGWNGPYIKGSVPNDPWGKPYVFNSPTADGGIEIISLGADGLPGGEGENADIRNKH